MESGGSNFFRNSLGIAALLVGLSVAYYFTVYLPGRDAANDLRERRREAEATLALASKKAADKKAEGDRKRDYRICLDNAFQRYSTRWDGHCNRLHNEGLEQLNRCIGNGYNVATCRSTIQVQPAKDCSLPLQSSDSYDRQFTVEKQLCLDSVKASLGI